MENAILDHLKSNPSQTGRKLQLATLLKDTQLHNTLQALLTSNQITRRRYKRQYYYFLKR